MLRGWTTPGWALIGGLLAVMEFGPLNQWTNSYWGGSLAAAAGCLATGLRALNAVPAVNQLPPGWVTALDLPLIPGVGTIR